MTRTGFMLGAALLLASTSLTMAQDFPTTTIKLVNPAPPGTGPDVLARIYAQRLSEIWKQPVVVENRPGAGGALAATEVARASPDGHTLLWAFNAVITINPVARANLPYKPATDLLPIVQVNTGAYVLVAPVTSGPATLSELITQAKSRPGQLNYASYGVGGGSHLASEFMLRSANINIAHVPFRTGPMNEIIAGRMDLLFEPAAGAFGAVQTGAVRALAVSGLVRMPQLPNVPTVAETLPGFNVDSWQGVFAPAKTSAAIVRKINADLLRISAEPDVRKRLDDLGFTPATGTPEEFAKLVESETARWARLAKDIDLKPE
jgi:tripartite-type tricarboxylate transporter receptor subunit TctC